MSEEIWVGGELQPCILTKQLSRASRNLSDIWFKTWLRSRLRDLERETRNQTACESLTSYKPAVMWLGTYSTSAGSRVFSKRLAFLLRTFSWRASYQDRKYFHGEEVRLSFPEGFRKWPCFTLYFLTKRTRKSTQVNVSLQTRTYIRTCDGWPNGFASRLASSRKSHKPYISHIYSWLAINLCRLALGGQTAKNLRRLAYEFELDQSQCKSSQVNVHESGRPNKTETKNLRRLASPFNHPCQASQVCTQVW